MATSIADVKRAKKQGFAVLRQYEDGHQQLSLEVMRTIKVLRAKEGGYQRNLNQRRVDEIYQDLVKRNGVSNYPEITVANVDGELQCIDGQHRLEAHLRAKAPIHAHVFTCTRQEAVEIFVRDNYKSRPLKRQEVVAASLNPLAITIRKLAKDFHASQIQVTNMVAGLLGKAGSGIPLEDPKFDLDERQMRAAVIVLDTWSKDARWRGITPAELPQAARAEFSKSIERSYSSVSVLWALGKLAKDNVANLNKLKSDIQYLRDADWKKSNINSLRELAKKTGTAQDRARLFAYIEREVLLPAYKNR